MFCSTVVAPGILIFADRTLPFTYIDYAMVEKAAKPGDKIHFRVTARDVRKNNCEGRVKRTWVDGAGRAFPLPTTRTIYQYGPNQDGTALRAIRPPAIQVPEDAAPGESSYVSEPEFWCFPLQNLYPIKADTMRVRIIILPKDELVIPGSGVTLTPKGRPLVVPADRVD